MEELHGRKALVDPSLGRGVQLCLRTGAQLAEVVGVEAKHLARKQREETGLGVHRVGERVEKGADHLDLIGRGEGGAARHHALHPTRSDRVDVEVSMRGDPKKQRHVSGALARAAVEREGVGNLRRHRRNLVAARPPHLSGPRAHLHVNARQVTGTILVLSVGVGVEVHEVRHGSARESVTARADALHEREDVRVAAVVDVEAHDAPLAHLSSAPAEDAHVGATEAIDRLLGVTNGAEVTGVRAGKKGDEPQLHGIGVLELVHHHEPEAALVRATNLVVEEHGAIRQANEVVVVQAGLLALDLLVAFPHAPREVEQRPGERGHALEADLRARERERRLGSCELLRDRL